MDVIESSQELNELLPALLKAQQAIGTVPKTKTARITTQSGGSYSYMYADLAAIVESVKSHLHANNLVLLQTVHQEAGLIRVRTTIAHVGGQWISHAIGLTTPPEPRAIGSAITYGRRYGLSILGVVTDEDDDAAAVEEARSNIEATRSAPTTQITPPGSGSQPPACPKCGGPMWDNRLSKKNPRAPDFKCKDSTCDGAIWPKKESSQQPQHDAAANPVVMKLRAAAAQLKDTKDSNDLRARTQAVLDLLVPDRRQQDYITQALFGVTIEYLSPGECQALRDWIKPTSAIADNGERIWLPSEESLRDRDILLKAMPQ